MRLSRPGSFLKGRAVGGLFKLSAGIDRTLEILTRIGMWCGLALVVVVCYDVLSRYFGVPKPFGLNSTMVQESEYWLHTFLFALVIGYTYTRQGHVRIDLIRDKLPLRAKYAIEMFGCVFFLISYSVVAGVYCYRYALASFYEGEASKSVIGLSHIWLLKSALPILFLLLGLAGISQLIKSTAGFLGKLPDAKIAETVGGDL